MFGRNHWRPAIGRKGASAPMDNASRWISCPGRAMVVPLLLIGSRNIPCFADGAHLLLLSVFLSLSLSHSLSLSLTHTHTHTHIYIYIRQGASRHIPCCSRQEARICSPPSPSTVTAAKPARRGVRPLDAQDTGHPLGWNRASDSQAPSVSWREKAVGTLEGRAPSPSSPLPVAWAPPGARSAGSGQRALVFEACSPWGSQDRRPA